MVTISRKANFRTDLGKVMKYRRIEGTSLQVSVIGFGGGRLGSFDNGLTPKGWLRLLEEAYNAGINLFDTAPSYTGGFSERLLGRFLQGRRDKVVVITKAGYEVRSFWKITRLLVSKIPKQNMKRLIKWIRAKEVRHVFEPRVIRRSVERSLRRLSTDYIDFLLLHSLPVSMWDTEELYDILDKLKKEGKIRYYGFSTSEIKALGRKSIPHRITVIGTVVSSLDVYKNIPFQKTLEELPINAIAYHPFGGGALFRAPEREISLLQEATHKRCAIELTNISRAQIAIVYLLSYKRFASIVCRMSSREHLFDVLRGVELLNL